MKDFFEIFYVFARVGVMTFGGGYAMLPILQREVIENKGWITNEEMMDYYALGQCLPGLIGVNTSLFVGHRYKGNSGAVAAALGVSFPSVVIIMILAGVISGASDILWVQHAFAGIRVCVCVQILNTVVKLLKTAIIDKLSFVIFAGVFILSLFLDISTVWYVIIVAALVLLLSFTGVLKEVKK